MQESSSNLLMVVLGVVCFGALAVVVGKAFPDITNAFFTKLTSIMNGAWKTA
ncbi:hypothetical protein [Bacillus thuringiensis]|uniref:hypothetical protein n=1 Tax=Bacillus thuringiensis TaxID=1428 RepID=UPI00159BD7D8|nr:hypothetical protein [Bacillus thuringiensis]